jgi:hypothetical protein
MKHTPGPWRAEGYKDLIVNGSDGVTLACCPGDTRKEGGIDEAIANARLIAASPDLLESCAELVRVLDALGEANVLGEWPVVRETITPIRAAIAKAQGQATEQTVQAAAASALSVERLQEVNAKLLAALRRVRAVLVEARYHACKEPMMANKYATVLQCSGGAVVEADDAIAFAGK